jgi:hypothetical protein
MNEHEQRIAIAEACGKLTKTYFCEDKSGDRCIGNREGSSGTYVHDLPDYLNDLNAMHEAEKMLWGMDWSNRYAFNDNLANTLKGRTVNRNEWDAETLLDATAAQRAEAFLQTLNLWPDDCDEAIIDPRGHEERSMM